MKKIFAFLKANKAVFSILIVSLISATAIGSGVILYNYKLNNKVCEVKFDTKGGTVIKEQQVKCGKNIKIPNDPSKEGFSFKHWSYNQEEYDFSKPILNNITLEAYYEEENVKEEITISFNSNGGSKIESIQIVSGNKIEKPVNPAKKGYKFIGWFVESNEFDFNSSIYEDIELIAKWEKESSSSNSNNSININNPTISPCGYKCCGSFTTSVPEKIVSIGYTGHVNWTWTTNGSYGGETDGVCYLTYKTSDSAIATVDMNGTIVAKSPGVAYIFECVNDVETKTELTCFKGKLNVVQSNNESQNEISVTSISLNKKTLSLNVGETETLTATISPSNATNQLVLWSSDNTSVATVSNGKVTAVGKGTATITATTVDGNKSASCLVTVSNPNLTATVSIGMQINATSNGVSKGISAKITAKGGTGVYNYYYIKLYKDGSLISQTSNTSSNSIFVAGYTNGNYHAEIEVHDSDGTVYKSTSGTTTISGF